MKAKDSEIVRKEPGVQNFLTASLDYLQEACLLWVHQDRDEQTQSVSLLDYTGYK